MNIETTTIDTSVREGFQSMLRIEVNNFFDSLRQNEYETIPSLQSNADLTRMQARVMLLGELEQFVLTLKQTKSKSY